MTNTPQGDRPDPTQPQGPSYPSYPGYVDPAYAGLSPYGRPTRRPRVPTRPSSCRPTRPTDTTPTAPVSTPPINTARRYPPGEPPEGPPSSKSPRWLWLVAALAVLLVVGLVIALVIVNSSKQDTVVAPLPPMPEPSTATTTRTPSTTTTLRPLPPVVPVPTPSTTPPRESAAPGATETVVYYVSGTGRAINITYVDTGGVLQTEFNVVLPWSKQVDLPSPAEDSASVSIINVGREVTCSITVERGSGAAATPAPG